MVHWESTGAVKILNDPTIPTRVNPIKGCKHNTLDLSIITPKLINNFISLKVDSMDTTKRNPDTKKKKKVINQNTYEVNPEEIR